MPFPAQFPDGGHSADEARSPKPGRAHRWQHSYFRAQNSWPGFTPRWQGRPSHREAQSQDSSQQSILGPLGPELGLGSQPGFTHWALERTKFLAQMLPVIKHCKDILAAGSHPPHLNPKGSPTPLLLLLRQGQDRTGPGQLG